MSNAALKSVAGSEVVVAEKDPKTFPGMLVAFKSQIAAALPKHINPDRMCRVALTSFRLNPLLSQCTPGSVFASVVVLAQQGLEPGLNGRAFLVPYKDRSGQYQCQPIPGWKGLVELANRTGRASVWTGAVFPGDDFSFQLGDDPHVTHRPGDEDDPAKLTHAYAVGRVRGNEYPVIEVWSNAKLQKHLKRYNKVGEKHYAYANWELYARKIPLLQVLKYLPSSPELEAAINLSYAADAGQQVTINEAIDGTFAPTTTSDSEAPPTYAELAEAINKAEDKDGVDLAESLIDKAIADEKQRIELHDLAKARRIELT